MASPDSTRPDNSRSAMSHPPMNPTSPTATLSYQQAGVDYDLIDPLKVTAQRAAAATAGHLAAHGFTEVAASRGESAYVVDVGPFYIASIVECLGSKALVADEMHALTGKSYYEGIAQDTIAMAINDLLFYWPGMDVGFRIIYGISAVASGVGIAGIGGWLVARGLAKTGVLSRFAIGRESTHRV